MTGPFMPDQVETVTRVRPPTKDPFGDITGPAAELDIGGCLFAPGPSPEAAPGQGSNQVTIDGTVYAPPGSPDVLPTDQLRIRGDLYQVVDRPQQWGPGGNAGVVIGVRRTTG
jgi:hypothetical protein